MAERDIDPSLLHRLVGGPLGGRKSADLPPTMSGQPLGGVTLKLPLAQPAQYSLHAVYRCNTTQKIDGAWSFDFVEVVGPEGEPIAAQEKPALSRTGFVAPSMGDHDLAEWSRVRSRVRGLVTGFCLGDAVARSRPGDAELAPGNAGPIALASLEGAIGSVHRAAVKGIGGWVGTGAWAGVARWAASVGLTSAPSDALDSDFWRPRWTSSFPGFSRPRNGSTKGILEALEVDPLHLSGPPTYPLRSNSDHIVARLITLGTVTLNPFNARDHANADWIIANNAVHSHSPEAQPFGVAAAQIAHRAVISGLLSAELEAQVLAEWHGTSLSLSSASRTLAESVRELSAGRDGLAYGKVGTARRTLFHGFRLALMADRIGVDEATSRAAQLHPGEAALGMGLIGAVHGIEALSQDLLARLELGWLADRLALDAMDLAERMCESGDHTKPHTNETFLRRYHAS